MGCRYLPKEQQEHLSHRCQETGGVLGATLKVAPAFVSSPTYAGSHGCQAVEECAGGVLRSLGEGGQASAGVAEETRGTTAVKPWGSTVTAD